jgi:hypothetical protein
VFDATGRFHNPLHAAEWSDPHIDTAMHDVLSLIVRGLAAPARATATGYRSGEPNRALDP